MRTKTRWRISIFAPVLNVSTAWNGYFSRPMIDVVLFYIPPYTPEMNPIEQIWKEIRKLGFKNEVFTSLDKVVDRLSLTICSLLPELISRITGRSLILNVFVSD